MLKLTRIVPYMKLKISSLFKLDYQELYQVFR